MNVLLCNFFQIYNKSIQQALASNIYVNQHVQLNCRDLGATESL